MTSQESKAALSQEPDTTTGEMADKTAQMWLKFRRYSGPHLTEPEMAVSGDNDAPASNAGGTGRLGRL
jgi:hypothetical protein